MVERIGHSSGLARAAIEAALKSQSEAVRRMSATAIETEAPAVQGADFGRALAEGVRGIDAEIKRADTLATDVVSGGIADFHEVAAQLKKSELSLRFALEVRNKFIDAYREIMRMSV